MKNTVTLSKKEIEEIKTKMFNEGFAQGCKQIEISTDDLIEINLNLTFAAKIVEKAGGPATLVEWLNHVNRKCIAQINKGETHKTK